MAFENGVQYINMISTGFEDLQKYIMQATNSTPSFYSYVRDGETGTIFIDRSTARKLRITYNSSIPEMTVDTIIKIPPEYISLLYMELAVSLSSDLRRSMKNCTVNSIEIFPKDSKKIL